MLNQTIASDVVYFIEGQTPKLTQSFKQQKDSFSRQLQPYRLETVSDTGLKTSFLLCDLSDDSGEKERYLQPLTDADDLGNALSHLADLLQLSNSQTKSSALYDECDLNSFSLASLSFDSAVPPSASSAATKKAAPKILPRLLPDFTPSITPDYGKAVDADIENLALQVQQNLRTLHEKNGIQYLINLLGEDFLQSLQQLSARPISRLVIDSQFRILLPDYEKEIHFPVLSKVVYLLFLNHPDGIRLKEIADYKQELRQLYLLISPRTDIQSMEQSINDLVDLESGSLNQKISRINAAFRCELEKDIAQHYLIAGPRGEKRRILLDTSKITIM